MPGITEFSGRKAAPNPRKFRVSVRISGAKSAAEEAVFYGLSITILDLY